MTALIVHPANDFNTFVDVAGADIIAEDFLEHGVWEALSLEDKQRWLLYTGNLIMNLNGLKLPDTAVECLGKVQVDIAIHHIRYSIDAVEAKQQVRLQYFNHMSTEFFKNEGFDKLIPEDVPATSWPCLESVGVKKPQGCGGVLAFRRTR